MLIMARACPTWKTCILLIGLHLHFTQSSITPRTSFFTGSPGRVLSLYNASDAQNTTELLLSPDATTLFVGARNTLLSLDVSRPDVITLKRKHDWAPEDPQDRCGNDQLNCANFIRILQFFNSTHLYACGSFAFKPHDVILTADNLSISRAAQNVKGRCPYKGSERNTAVFVDGELYAATTNDYSGSDPDISRHFSKEPKFDLKLEKVPKRLYDTTFISSFFISSEGKVYVFLREEGTEYNFMQRFTVSRVAQVCTNDNGGERVLQKRWTTFAKSQLVCQKEKQLPFNLLQDIVMVPPPRGESPDQTLFYGIFTSQWLSGQSAVCAFTLKEIKAAFSGDYKTQNRNTNQWTTTPNTVDAKLGKCGLHEESDDVLNLVKKTFLTAKPVQSLERKQLLTTTEQLYRRITAQRVQAANGQHYTVLYLLTETGFLQKAVLLNNRPHIIEEIQVFKQPQILTSILLSVEKGMVFVGYSEGVIRVPVVNCSFYSSCAECVLARDPFCGWDSQSKGCVQVSSEYSSLHQDVENGSVKEQCEDRENQNGAPVPKVVRVHLNKLVKLPCRSGSALAKVSWRFSNHSTVPQSRFLQHGDGSLVFRASPGTALEFQCATEELGFQQVQAIFSVTVQASPRSYITAQQAGVEVELIPQSHLLDDTPQKSYYNEMVAVSFLFALSLCVIAVGLVLWRKKDHDKAAPEYATNEDFSINST